MKQEKKGLAIKSMTLLNVITLLWILVQKRHYSLFNISMGSSTTRCKGLFIMKKGFFHLRHEFFLKDNSKLKNAGIITESENISVKNFTDKYFSYLKIVL